MCLSLPDVERDDDVTTLRYTLASVGYYLFLFHSIREIELPYLGGIDRRSVGVGVGGRGCGCESDGRGAGAGQGRDASAAVQG